MGVQLNVLDHECHTNMAELGFMILLQDRISQLENGCRQSTYL